LTFFLGGEGDKISKNLCCTYYVLMDFFIMKWLLIA